MGVFPTNTKFCPPFFFSTKSPAFKKQEFSYLGNSVYDIQLKRVNSIKKDTPFSSETQAKALFEQNAWIQGGEENRITKNHIE